MSPVEPWVRVVMVNHKWRAAMAYNGLEVFGYGDSEIGARRNLGRELEGIVNGDWKLEQEGTVKKARAMLEILSKEGRHGR